MTATNICYNFIGFRCIPPINSSKQFSKVTYICILSVNPLRYIIYFQKYEHLNFKTMYICAQKCRRNGFPKLMEGYRGKQYFFLEQ